MQLSCTLEISSKGKPRTGAVEALIGQQVVISELSSYEAVVSLLLL